MLPTAFYIVRFATWSAAWLRLGNMVGNFLQTTFGTYWPGLGTSHKYQQKQNMVVVVVPERKSSNTGHTRRLLHRVSFWLTSNTEIFESKKCLNRNRQLR